MGGARRDDRAVDRRPVRKTLLALLALAVLGVAGLVSWRQRRPSLAPPPAPERLAALRSQRAALQARFEELTSGANDVGLGEAPRAGLLIGIPTSFARTLVEQVVAGPLGSVRLRLRGLRFHKADEVRGKLLFGMRTFGRYQLDVVVEEVRGELRPHDPGVSFSGSSIGLTLPVRLAEGGGRASIRLQWDSRGLANAVCGDFDVTRELQATVVPADYRLKGRFELQADGGMIVLSPRFGEVKFRLKVEPSEASWRVVDALVDDQKALCRAALGKVDVRAKLQEVVAAGFEIKLPARLMRPIRLPAVVEQSLTLEGMTVELALKPAGLKVGERRLWYGVDVEARGAVAGSPAPPG